MLLLFLASALIGSGVLFHHKRVLTYIALAGALFEAEMLLTTFLYRTTGHSLNGPTFFLVAGIIFTTLWIACYRWWKSPYSIPGSGKRDVYVGIALLIVFASAYPIISSNGFVGDEFVMHGFYNGDVATFASLVQKSFNTSRLVSENPFSANGSLEYPTLLHGTVSDFFSLLGIGKDWLRYIGLMTYVQIFLTIPLFFLLWDTVYPEPKNPAEKWFGLISRSHVYFLQLLLTLVAISLSFDSFVYPQSHFFLIGVFLASIALLAKASTLQGREQLLPLITGFSFALVLLMANTVTGTVAAALIGILCFVRIFDRKRPVPERVLFLLIALLVAFAMKQASDGRTAFNHIHFSVSSAGDMVRAGLPTLFILGAALYSLSRKQYIAIAASAVSLLGFIVFFLSDRNIVTENASRFLYHSFLIGFVLLLPLIIQALYWIKRELLATNRPMSELISGWALVVCAALILVLPIGISTGNTYINLLRNGEQRISTSTRLALWWIDDHTPANAVIITNPNEPFSVPIFTGRAMLRAKDYWLSQDDNVVENLKKAYAGDKSAQQEVLSLGSFLFLTKEDAKNWDTTKLQKVSDTGDALVYTTR
jgi:hypothetical protein